ncbi:MAG TPA: carboxypeptidase-like regulatory domain-containing protein [Sphingomicrobium sp.]|nr:carboxypeptidase-like regulatory domain-containing protein [Sphingomicrobium sp.]
MRRGRLWLRKLATLLALTGAGSVTASAANPPQPDGWVADPEAQFLLDVRIRQYKLGDGVRAYQTPEGTCVMLGDFIATLDVPVTVDLMTKKAAGWAFKEDNRIAIDLASRTASYRGRQDPIASGTIRETPEGWCVDTAALARWFGIGVKPVTTGSVVLLESEAKLPVEMAVERQQRAAHIKPAKFDLSTLPQVRLAYRMWRTPALDFIVSAGVTYRADSGAKVDRRTSIFAAGELARLSYDANLSTDERGRPANLRLRAFRSDPDARLLGPLGATHLGLGDVATFDSRLTAAPASGRGAVVTNRPLYTQAAFDRTRFEGDLPAGWDAEIYRNDELLGFARPSASQRYVFDDVQLHYGENRIRIMLYGPQGQVRTREELINVGQDHVPPGKTWYWAGFNQPGAEVLSFDKPPDDETRPRAQAAFGLEHGLDHRTSAGALARMMLVGDERLTFVEGTVRRAIGSALVEVAAAAESGGGRAARAQLLAKLGSVNVSAEAVAANDFHLRGDPPVSKRDVKLTVDAPLRVGRVVLPAHGDLRLAENRDGSRDLEAAARLAANVQRFNLATHLRYRKHYSAPGPAPPGQLNAGLIGSGRLGAIRLRAATDFEIGPQARFRYAELSAYWSATDRTDWEGALAYDSQGRRGRARISHVRRLSTMAVALTGEAATDGSVALGLNLNFSLDASRGLLLSRQPLAVAGAVHARVYRDLNDNGLRDPGEPLEKGALITTGSRLSERPTNARGSVLVGGLSTFTPVVVGIDQSSLADPMLVPKKAMQVVVPRPGVPAEVEIGLVGGGDIEGAIVRSGGLGVEGVDVELVDAAGRLVATARTDFDGFFLFERIAYGDYNLRLGRESAAAIGVPAGLGVVASLSAGKSVVRLGAIHLSPPARIASSQ